MKAFAVCVLVACSPPPRPKPPPERDAPDAKPLAPRPGKQFPAPPAGFATSDFVTMIGGDLSTYAIVGGKLELTGTTRLVNVDPNDEDAKYERGIGYGGWADRDHLFLTTAGREIAMVTATAITETPIPSEDHFKTPKPDGEHDPGDTRGSNGSGTGLVVTEGEAWWTTCPWGIAADGFQCHEHVNARLWPTVKLDHSLSQLRSREFAWVDRTPPGHTMKPTNKAVTCEQGGTKATFTADSDPNEEIYGAHWVSASPPRLLVIYGHFGYASLNADRWTLHAGCALQPLATGTRVAPGPGDLWIAQDGDGATKRQILYRGAVELGALPARATIFLRPLAK